MNTGFYILSHQYLTQLMIHTTADSCQFSYNKFVAIASKSNSKNSTFVRVNYLSENFIRTDCKAFISSIVTT